MTENTIDYPEGGTLYIKGERDRVTGDPSDYYKVGIVRGEKEARDRDGALRTGNPRVITTLFELQTPFVQRLETRLHNEFAPGRISSGEWFHESLVPVTEVQARAISLGAELSDKAEAISFSEAEDGPGEAPAVGATDDVIDLASRLSALGSELKAVSSLTKEVEKALQDAATEEPSLREVYFKRSDRGPTSSLSATEVKKRFPELYDQFVESVEAAPRKKWSLPEMKESHHIALSARGLPETVEVEALASDPSSLHQLYLRAWAAASIVKWEQWLLTAELSFLAQGTQGIDGILHWEARSSKTFNKKAFEAMHPAVAEECTVQKPASVSYSPAEWLVPLGAVEGLGSAS